MDYRACARLFRTLGVIPSRSPALHGDFGYLGSASWSATGCPLRPPVRIPLPSAHFWNAALPAVQLRNVLAVKMFLRCTAGGGGVPKVHGRCSASGAARAGRLGRYKKMSASPWPFLGRFRSECFDSEISSNRASRTGIPAGTGIAIMAVYTVIPISNTHFEKRGGAVRSAVAGLPRLFRRVSGRGRVRGMMLMQEDL